MNATRGQNALRIITTSFDEKKKTRHAPMRVSKRTRLYVTRFNVPLRLRNRDMCRTLPDDALALENASARLPPSLQPTAADSRSRRFCRSLRTERDSGRSYR